MRETTYSTGRRKKLSSAQHLDSCLQTYCILGEPEVVAPGVQMVENVAKLRVDSSLCRLNHHISHIVGVCSSNWLTTRRGTRNLIYTLPLFFLNFLQLLLTQQLSQFYQLFYYYSTSPSSGIVVVLIAKAGHVWVNRPEEFLLYISGLLLLGNTLAYAQLQLISTK